MEPNVKKYHVRVEIVRTSIYELDIEAEEYDTDSIDAERVFYDDLRNQFEFDGEHADIDDSPPVEEWREVSISSVKAADEHTD